MHFYDDLSGRTLGAFKLIEKLAAGGMGVVYRAVDVRTGLPVAVKVLSSRLASEHDFLARFRRECQVQKELTHPNLVRLLDFGQADDQHYLVLELLQGRTALQLVQGGWPVTFELGLTVGRALAQALIYLHGRDLLHRDIKPGNVFVTDDRQVKLMDFGLVKNPNFTQITVVGEKIGTPRYMAPETLFDAVATRQSDIYQVGMVLYELLSARSPYENKDSGNYLNQLKNVGPTPISTYRPDVPDPIVSVIDRCLSYSPDGRYPDAGSLLEALETAAAACGPTSLAGPRTPGATEEPAAASRSRAVQARAGPTGSGRASRPSAVPVGQPVGRGPWVVAGAILAGSLVIAIAILVALRVPGPVAVQPAPTATAARTEPTVPASNPVTVSPPASRQPRGKPGFSPVTADDARRWSEVFARAAGREDELARAASDYRSARGRSVLREPTLGPAVSDLLLAACRQEGVPRLLARLEPESRESPFFWVVLASFAASAQAHRRSLVYGYRGLTWLLAAGPDGIPDEAWLHVASQLARAEERSAAPQWALFVVWACHCISGGRATARLVADIHARASDPHEGPWPAGPPAADRSAATPLDSDPEIASHATRVREAVAAVRDGQTSAGASQSVAAVRSALEALRDLLYTAAQKGLSLEWGSVSEAGATGVLSQIAQASGVGDGLDPDSPARLPFKTFVSFLKGQEVRFRGDSGYWEARSIVHRIAAERTEEERALLWALPAWSLRTAGWRHEPERRAAILERLGELVRQRAPEPAGAVEPLPGDWPPVVDGSELWRRRSAVIAVWLASTLARDRTTAASAPAALAAAVDALNGLDEPDGAAGLAAWARPRESVSLPGPSPR